MSISDTDNDVPDIPSSNQPLFNLAADDQKRNALAPSAAYAQSEADNDPRGTESVYSPSVAHDNDPRAINPRAPPPMYAQSEADNDPRATASIYAPSVAPDNDGNGSYQSRPNPPDYPPNHSLSSDLFYQAPDQSARTPKLYNQKLAAGARYLSIGGIFKRQSEAFIALISCHFMIFMQVLAGMYFWRTNSIPGPHQFDAAMIQAIWNMTITKFKARLPEVYKRLAMRMNAVYGNAQQMNWKLLPVAEMKRFRSWLTTLAVVHDGNNVRHQMWVLGRDNDGVEYIQLLNNEFTLAWCRTLNGMYDTLKMFEELIPNSPNGDYIKWIYDQKAGKRMFDFS